MIGVMSVFSLQHFDAMAYRSDCTSNTSAGEYCKNAGNKPSCPGGCYCTGGTKFALGTDYSADDYCRGVVGDDWHFDSAHIYRCPDYYSSSPAGSSSVSNCYNASNNFRYRNDLSCSAGKYLPANSETCADCLDGYVCTGISGKSASSSDQGLSTCPDGKQPNADKSACEGAVQCPKGSYLPKNTQTCAECPDGFVCKGGSFRINQPTDQGKLYPKDACPGSKSIVNKYRDGCESCLGGNMKANEDHTECVEHDMDIAPGYYLKANATAPSACFGAKKFCPGGTFSKQAEDQGRYDCPFGANATADNKGCQLKLTKKQMENGASGAGKCWLKTNVEDFKSCIYGVRIQEIDPSAAETSTIRDFLKPASSIGTVAETIRDFLKPAGSIGTIVGLKSMDE